jgi:hypothetical protein
MIKHSVNAIPMNESGCGAGSTVLHVELPELVRLLLAWRMVAARSHVDCYTAYETRKLVKCMQGLLVPVVRVVTGPRVRTRSCS